MSSSGHLTKALGVSPKVIIHRLNTNLTFRPIRQKGERSSPQHSEAVIDEIQKLLEAKSIREVMYSTWLANTIIVKKKKRVNGGFVWISSTLTKYVQMRAFYF